MADEPVLARRERVTIPTYAVGQPDPTPPVARPWGYSRIYPYSMLDDLTDQKRDVEYEALVLENDFLRIDVLPELGGHLYAFDKIAGRDMFYRPAVIKPALIALRGAWIAGGIEFNFPVSHNPLTLSPVNHDIRENDDGSAAIMIGAYEQLSRMRWSVEIRLAPDVARIDADVRLENRTPLPHRFYFWSNSAEPVTEGTRFISPVTSVRGWKGLMSYPEHDGEYVPAYRNHNTACDLFSRNVQADFFGCYDDDTDSGVINVADHHEVTGRKYFTWGNSDDGLVWQHILSDDAGPYIEIQSGPFETQDVFKLIGPHRVVRWSESWYPIRRSGGFEFANGTVAMNLRTDDNGRNHLLIHGVRPIIDVAVTAELNGKSVGAWDVDLAPAKLVDLVIDADIGNGQLRIVLSSHSERVIADAMLPWRGEEDVLTEAPGLADSERETVHGLVARGIDAEQHNEIPAARTCYEKAIELDPLAALALVRLGALELAAGRTNEALTLLERAARVLPDAGDVNYYLGMARRRAGDDSGARAAFWQTRLDAHYSGLGRYQLGEMAAFSGDPLAALAHFRSASNVERLGTPECMAQVTMLRVLKRSMEAFDLLARVEAADSLNLVAACERAMLDELSDSDDGWRRLRKQIGDDAQVWIELAMLYAGYGHRVMALRLLDAAAAYKSRPLVHYHRAFHLDSLDRPEEAMEARRQAITAQVDGLYAHRPEEEAILRAAMQASPSDSTAPYLVGTMLYMLGRPDEGRESWQIGLERGSMDPSLYAVVGWSAWKLDGDLDAALAHYQRAADLRPHDHRLYASLDSIRDELGIAPQERLAALGALAEPVRDGGRMPQRYVQLCTATGAYDEAIERLESRRFDPWEGERTMRGVYVDAHTARGESLMDAEDYPSAFAAFERALDYPVNVGVGKPHQAADSPSLYRAGVACAASGDDARAGDYWTQGAAETWHAATSESGLYAALCTMKLSPAEGRAHVGDVRDALAAVPDASADVLALLGVAASALGNEDKAREAFEAALRKSPYHLLASRERARLG